MGCDCGRVIVTVAILAQWIISGLGVVLTPCRVENILTQPQYATSLATKALVQIIQIPPVFTQNVMVGKCMNKDLELSDRPGDYFICRQRYSSVEVYVTELTDLLHIESNSTNKTGRDEKSLGSIFRSTNFIRESVVVESGCDFTFNLLPLLMRQQEASQGTPTRREDLPHQNYRLLRSPYHKNHPNANVPSNSKGPIASSFQTGNLQGPLSPQPQHQHQHQQGGNQYSSSGTGSPSFHQGPLYSPSPLGDPSLPPLPQSGGGGGGAPYSQIALPPHSQIPVYGEQQQRPAEGVYQPPPRPSSMAIRERAEQDESSYHTHHPNPHYPSADSDNEIQSYESSEAHHGKYNGSSGGGGDERLGEYYETTELSGEGGGEETPYGGGGGEETPYGGGGDEETPYGGGGGEETPYGGGGGAGAALPQETGGRGVGEELYTSPHKVGMPLLILDKEYDPLLKSIRGSSYSDNNFVS